ncbi:unnamed protein product [Mytilus edulis]|uniref:Endonuclease/exonuclease/phosphatase domain-containing protein n=1 Tax=Mytilus edulis TaxID=6550 RepID=A0A8S3Q9B3_MYTED|nr:unnamed protein product [Mytilus edulis]
MEHSKEESPEPEFSVAMDENTHDTSKENIADSNNNLEKNWVDANLIDALEKINTYQQSVENDLQLKIQNVHDMFSSIQNQPKNTEDTFTVTPYQKKISELQKDNQSLELQLKIERNNEALNNANFECALQHERSLVSNLRKELESVITTSTKEIAFNSDNYEAKKKHQKSELTKTVRQLNMQVSHRQDENMSIKSQLANLYDDQINRRTNTNPDKTEEKKCIPDIATALMVGTSNLKGINEKKITPAVEITKVIAFTIDQAKEKIDEYEVDKLSLVILHIITNDLTTKDPATCLKEIQLLITDIQKKWEKVLCIVSLATPRLGNVVHHTNGQIINAMLRQSFAQSLQVHLVDHSNMCHEGMSMAEFLADDGYHLNEKGTSQLAANMKRMIHATLNIPFPYRERSDRKIEKFDIVFLAETHIGPETDIFDGIERDVLNFKNNWNILLCGDFNARVGSKCDFIVDDDNNYVPIFDTYQSDRQNLLRNSYDTKINTRGKDLIDLCISHQLRFLNGRIIGDLFGKYTCYKPVGASVVDYAIMSESALNQVLYFKVYDFIPTLSDCHSKIEWNMSAHFTTTHTEVIGNILPLSCNYVWSDDSSNKFQDALSSIDIQKMIFDFEKSNIQNSADSVNAAAIKLSNIFINAADKSLRKPRPKKITKHNCHKITGLIMI